MIILTELLVDIGITLLDHIGPLEEYFAQHREELGRRTRSITIDADTNIWSTNIWGQSKNKVVVKEASEYLLL